MRQKTLTDMERNNKTAMLAHGIDAGIMTIFCVLQAVGGLKSWGYVLIVAVLAAAPVIGELIFWKRDRATTMIKHFVAIGFAIFYTFILFTSIHGMVYTFVIPMILVVAVYNDIRYSLLINIGTVLESIIVVALGAQTGGFGYMGSDSAVIQIVVMILVGIYSVFSAKTINDNTKQKLANVMEAQEQTQQVLTDITCLSGTMKAGIEKIDADIERLNEAAKDTENAMNEVSVGSRDTAQAVQEQLLQTEAIQTKVASVDEAAGKITENMEKNLQILDAGNKDIEELVRQVEASVKSGAEASQKLENLDEYMQKMHSIVELINGITNQTSMLALNASIEAARAGEAGKGFAVVASEITGMASKTKDATLNIESLIADVSKAIEEVVTVVEQIVAGIKEQETGAGNVSDSFGMIFSNTVSVKENMEGLAHNIDELKGANQVIVDSVQTISAITEEVSAHAGETLEAQENNTEILEKITAKMKELMEAIHQ